MVQRAAALPGHAFDDTPEGYLVLGDPRAVKDASGRLKDSGGFAKKDRITHKVEIASEVDLEIALPWLKRAYERDGKA